jgi:hypothetical protein
MLQRLALSLLVFAATAIAASSQSFENSAIVRTVDLGGALVHVTTTFAAKALESDTKAYTITLPDEEIYRTSWLEVKIKGQQQPLTVTYGGAPAERCVSSVLTYIPPKPDVILQQIPQSGCHASKSIGSQLDREYRP